MSFGVTLRVTNRAHIVPTARAAPCFRSPQPSPPHLTASPPHRSALLQKNLPSRVSPNPRIFRTSAFCMSSFAAGSRAINAEHAEVVLVKNETPLPCTLSSGDWLSGAPRGAYTTARTVGVNSIFEFEAHVGRLVKSVTLMLEADETKAQQTDVGEPILLSAEKVEELTKEETLLPKLLASLKAAKNEYKAAGEIKITVLITWDSKGYTIFSHFCPLPARPQRPVKVMAKGAPRSNAAAKDSDWVRERKALEDEKPEDVNEILLVEEDGHILEGMSSNFFAVTKDGALVTAGEGILEGTVRLLMLQVCEREGIPVILKAPQLKDVDNWEGAIVSSTSRLALPIDQLTYTNTKGEIVQAKFSDDTLTRRIETLVQEEIETNSSNVF